MHLLREAARGNDAAFEALVVQHYPRLLRLAARLRGSDRAEEIVQEAFLRLYLSAGDLRGEAAVFTWLYRVTVNLCRDDLRREHRRARAISRWMWGLASRLGAPALAEPSVAGGTPGTAAALAIRFPAGAAWGPEEAEDPRASTALTAVERAAVRDALVSLPEEQRLVVLLHDVEGLSCAEVAQAIGRPIGTVKSRLAAARTHLRKALDEEGEAAR